MSKIPPPPTRYGPASAQAKSGPARPDHSCPPTRYGPVTAQAKAAGTGIRCHAPPPTVVRVAPTAAITPLPVARVAQPKANGVIQRAFTAAGTAARARVCAITGEATGFDPYDGSTFAEWSPAGNRIGFNAAIRAYVLANAPHDAGNPAWITCAYCNWEYPPNRIQIDHVVDWFTYSTAMTTAATLGNARAWEVYIGCNDPNNLVAACDSCNASKGNNPLTAGWIAGRQALANANHGF